MVEETKTDEQEPATEGQAQVVEPVLDVYLAVLINTLAADKTNSSNMSVTLVMAGAVVHGTMISRGAWVEDWETQMGKATGRGAELLAILPATLDKAWEEEHGPDAESPLPRFVHMRDVTIVTGAAASTIRTPLWRGRLAAVSGWSMGIPG